jgi:hypothetical protein
MKLRYLEGPVGAAWIGCVLTTTLFENGVVVNGDGNALTNIYCSYILKVNCQFV